ncbi:hypothetical protein [Limosilactobacillus equigenerosi]|nr:hypothetical protein [Limosilactobacillus equigenerosi]
MSQNDEFIRLKDAAKLVGVKADTLRKRIERGHYGFKNLPVDLTENYETGINKRKIKGETWISKKALKLIQLDKAINNVPYIAMVQDLLSDDIEYLDSTDIKQVYDSLIHKLVNRLKEMQIYSKGDEEIVLAINELVYGLIQKINVKNNKCPSN